SSRSSTPSIAVAGGVRGAPNRGRLAAESWTRRASTDRGTARRPDLVDRGDAAGDPLPDLPPALRCPTTGLVAERRGERLDILQAAVGRDTTVERAGAVVREPAPDRLALLAGVCLPHVSGEGGHPTLPSTLTGASATNSASDRPFAISIAPRTTC